MMACKTRPVSSMDESEEMPRERRSTYSEANLNNRPGDETLAVCNALQVLDTEDTNDLYDSDEKSQSENTCQDKLLLPLEL